MSLIHSIPLFTIVLSLLTSVICSIVNAKWAKRIYAVTGLIVIGLTTFLMETRCDRISDTRCELF